MPRARPRATSRAHLVGRTNPRSRHGVRDQDAHNSTNNPAVPGTGKLPARRMTRMATMPTGPKPRSLRPKESLGQLLESLILLRPRLGQDLFDVRAQFLLAPLVAGRQLGGVRVAHVGALEHRGGGRRVVAGVALRRQKVAPLGPAGVLLNESA